MKRFQTIVTGLLVAVMLLSGAVFAQTQDGNAPPANAASQLPLDQQQMSISQRYERFEQTLLKIVDITRETDPARADLLLRAIGKSREMRISPQIESIVQLLGQERLGEAGTRQDDLIKSLAVVLEILQSEDERARIKNEMERVQDLLKDLDRVVGKQKDVRADTERGGDFAPLGKKQEDVEKLAEELQKKMAQQDAELNEKSGGKKPKAGSQDPSQQSGDPKESGEPKEPGTEEKMGEDSKKPDSEKNEDEKKQDKPGEKKPGEESKSGESSPPESGETDEFKKPQNSKSQQQKSQQQKNQKSPQNQDQSEQSDQEQSDQSQQDQQQSQQPQQPKTPGREELEKAKKKMDEAIEELKKKQRENASEKQDEALLELQKAKAKLEELLRQLREEELELVLMALEARFRRMLEMEYQIKNGTVKLAELPEQERLSHHSQRAVQLSRDQSAIRLEAEDALVLLKEEGSSVAFPEAVIQLRDDMGIVVGRLEKMDVGEITLAIEDDVIEGLKELIESLQKELEKLQNKQQDQQQQKQQEQQEPGLVDQLAELKLLRSLQQRINRRTRQYSLQVDGEQATDQQIRALLKELSARQQRVFKATYDLSSGQNK